MIKTKPFGAHQTQVVNFCTEKEETQEYAGIFADYGTGKTWCALSIIEKMDYKKVLVVATT
jgi:predicted helicase